MKLSDRLRNIMARAGFDDASTEWRGDSVFIGRNDNDAVIKAADELDRLASAMPKTADGVTIVPRMEVWVANDHGFVFRAKAYEVCNDMAHIDETGDMMLRWEFGENLYSTKEAAEEAAKK